MQTYAYYVKLYWLKNRVIQIHFTLFPALFMPLFCMHLFFKSDVLFSGFSSFSKKTIDTSHYFKESKPLGFNGLYLFNCKVADYPVLLKRLMIAYNLLTSFRIPNHRINSYFALFIIFYSIYVVYYKLIIIFV